MNRWLQNSINNLLPLSDSDTFDGALREWQTNGDIVEAEDGETFVCELCEKEELATHFGITNTRNGNTMYVGSKCILKFSGIVVIDPDTKRAVDGDERRKVLNRQLSRMKRKKEKDRKDIELAALMKDLAQRHIDATNARIAQEKTQRDAYLARLRELYRRATKSQPFIAEIGKAVKQGQKLTPAQQRGIAKLLDAFGM